MVHAFVLVRTEAGRSKEVCDTVVNHDSITEAHVIAGDYDVIAVVDTPAVPDLLEVTTETIQAVEGVTGTQTYISLSE